MAEACEPDVVTFCSAEKGQAHGNAEVLKCLVKVRDMCPQYKLGHTHRVDLSNLN